MKPQPKLYLLVDWGDGSADKKKNQILADEPDAVVDVIKVRWAK